MTGRELIVYILQNGLEDEPIVKDGCLIGHLTEIEAAIRYGVGTATIRTWASQGVLDAAKIGNMIFVPKNSNYKKG